MLNQKQRMQRCLLIGLCSVKTHHPICQDFDVFFCIISSSDDGMESSAILRHRLLAHDYGYSVFRELDVAQWYASREVTGKRKSAYISIPLQNNVVSCHVILCYVVLCYYGD